MQDLIAIEKIILYLLNILALWIGLLVFLGHHKTKNSKIFLFMTVFTLLWIDFAYLSQNVSTASTALLFIRLAYSAGSIFFIFYYFLSFNFPEERTTSSIINILVTVIFLLFAFIAFFSDLIVKNIKFTTWGVDIVYGRLIIVFYSAVIALVLIVLIYLLKKYQQASFLEKIRIQYFLVGFFITSIINLLFNVFMPLWRESLQYFQFGNYSTVVFLIFTAYAIVKRQLFGIKVVLTEFLVGLIGVLLLLNFFTSQTTFEYVWKGMLFGAFVFFGILLIKSVIKEIKQKEELDKLATQLATANIRLEGAYNKLKKLDDAKSEFISIASHQLRTPLATIKGYTSMLLEGDYGRLFKKSVGPIQSVYNATERLINLVNSLLNISRIESGKMKLELSETDIKTLVNEVVEELTPQAYSKQISLIFQQSSKIIPKVWIDREKIANAVANLVDNALKYTEKGGVEIKSELKVENQKDIIRITIADTGEGFGHEEIEKLFQSFSRAGAGKKFWVEGAGLGLYIARQFVEMHNGKIWAESEGKGKGSKFIIELPTDLYS